ncbi:MAG: hypothetical protein HKN26_08000 [Acidimicrobiales bacterium]|nr:hypothetical protein [Acidimicrobiales bacterium]
MILEPNLTGVPVPQPTPLSKPYWDGCAIGELRYQRCTDCGAASFGPAHACHRCRGRSLEWTAGTGRGAVYSWTIVGRPPLAAFVAPYAPCIVRLDEGYDMVSALVGIDPAELERIGDGLRVQVEFHPVADSITLPFFAPADRR